MVQPSDNPTAARIRENQRRSRARRKEYIQDVERRLAEYEQRGIEATQEMQAAARNVAMENSRLRMMLAQRGVHEHEIQDFFHHCDQSQHAHQNVDRLAVLADASCCDTSSVGTATPSESKPPSLVDTNDSTPATSESASPMLMSCSAAAQIIADMQGMHESSTPAQVRASLGCKNECECLVKNTLLFQLLDHNHDH